MERLGRQQAGRYLAHGWLCGFGAWVRVPAQRDVCLSSAVEVNERPGVEETAQGDHAEGEEEDPFKAPDSQGSRKGGQGGGPDVLRSQRREGVPKGNVSGSV